eukprot:gene7267-9906_t
MLSFDEFKAIKNREDKSKPIQTNEQQNSNDQVKSTNNNSSTKSTENASYFSTILNSIGDFLETNQMQVFYIFLIFIDSFLAIIELSLTLNPIYQTPLQPIALSLFNTISNFILFFFGLEMIFLFLVFGLRLFSHWGYLLDLLILSIQIYLSSQEIIGKESRILNIFRFWRIFRLFNAFLLIEHEKFDKIVTEMESVKLQLKQTQLENSNIQNEISKEKDARNAIESMLQNYKDEVDTLNEALKIAAMDIAEVADADDDEYMIESEDEDDQQSFKVDDSNDDDVGFEDAHTSKYSRYASKESMMRAVMEDRSITSNRSSNSGLISSSTGGKKKHDRNTAFVINEDGSYDKR